MSIADILKAAGVVLVASMSQMTGIINSTNHGKPIVVNIYSEFCGYSHQMASAFANYCPMNDHKNVAFYGADANAIEGIGAAYEIKGVPTFIGFACGKEVNRVTGADQSGLSQLLTELGNTQCWNARSE